MTNADSLRTFNRVLELADEMEYAFEAVGNTITLYKKEKTHLKIVKNYNTMEEILSYLEGVMACTLNK